MTHKSFPFELLILDCDGVVVDSEPITTRVLAQMLNELGVTISVEEVVATFSGHTFTLEFASKRLGTSLPHEFIENYRDRTFAAMEAELKPVQGVEIALDQITIPYCVASNGCPLLPTAQAQTRLWKGLLRVGSVSWRFWSARFRTQTTGPGALQVVFGHFQTVRKR